jgi:hypothetical protein
MVLGAGRNEGAPFVGGEESQRQCLMEYTVEGAVSLNSWPLKACGKGGERSTGVSLGGAQGSLWPSLDFGFERRFRWLADEHVKCSRWVRTMGVVEFAWSLGLNELSEQ